jgi:hypothetical protein
MVIPAMDHIEDVLSTNATSARYSRSIKSALSIGRRTLNKYYSKTDFSEAYRIAMGMFYIALINLITDLVVCSLTPALQAHLFPRR